MKRSRKLVLLLALLLLLSQLPFAYRRYKLRRLNFAIQAINASRKPTDANAEFVEYKGVAHVHSFLGGHSTGTFTEIISAAQANQLQFVIMTEHAEKDFNTADMTLRGAHGGILFINGNEISAGKGDRFLVWPGMSEQAASNQHLMVAAYPEEFGGWSTATFDAVEIYNVYTNARRVNPILALFDSIWSRRTYPALLFSTFYRRPAESLKKWDLALTQKKVVGTAGNDAHANIGVNLQDDSGKTLLGVKLDPYDVSFQLVRMHVLVPRDQPLTSDSLLNAIKAGHLFIGFDLFGETSGFSFSAANGAERKIQGDEIQLQPQTALEIQTPVPARLVVLKDGNVILDESGQNSREIPVRERGVYRLEVYLPQLGKPVGEQPWIISNPIYVR